MKGNVTIRDVARSAEVSVGTASRVINGKATVGADVRGRVLKAIEALGYRPDAIAQSMRRGSTHVIGCVIRDINIPSLAAFVHAAHNVLDRAGFSLLVSNSEGREDRERELLMRLNSQRSDGIMIGPYTAMTPAFDTFLRSLGAPIVMVDRDEPPWADAVMVDHAGATRKATSRLIDLGHQRIALLTGGPSIYPARERIRGFTEAFEIKNVALDRTLIRANSFLSPESFRQTSALLAAKDPPTAIIAGGIDMLAGVIRAIRVRGLTIPDDISLIGAGDSELAELHMPAISVQHWDQGEVGAAAASLLLARIRQVASDEPQHILVRSELIERDSTSAPRQRSSL
ncbi:LacI family DNA-binding transcriptional regulator [Bradyrhizobium canariense]|uniref:Transcriptional regulator, LacI family n=1 Tax=Bradyrhizobium canariense TaxID=255045 RepID=A0A1H1T854_9BRAD|nr:LacI family DNA-binding transcriptional regulator [Bradyrhizobium canariense]SDS56338.1 transcriptional regulator, LacI family [Bradyrhizobium canariense]